MGQQSHSATNTKLERIAWLSKQDPAKEFECLMHLSNQESLMKEFLKDPSAVRLWPISSHTMH